MLFLSLSSMNQSDTVDCRILLPDVLLLRDGSCSDSTEHKTPQSSVESRWDDWFRSCPLLSIPLTSEDSFLEEFIRTLFPENLRGTEKESYLRRAYVPTESPLLNTAQLHVIIAFLDQLTTTNDALSLRTLLCDRLFCYLSTDHPNLIQVVSSPSSHVESRIRRRFLPSPPSLLQPFALVPAGFAVPGVGGRDLFLCDRPHDLFVSSPAAHAPGASPDVSAAVRRSGSPVAYPRLLVLPLREPLPLRRRFF